MTGFSRSKRWALPVLSAVGLGLATFVAVPSAYAATVPGPPTGVTATPGNGSAVVKWTAPSSNGGSAITGYSVTATPVSKTCSTTSAKTCTVTGLTNGTTYTVTVRSKNALGKSAASIGVTVKPGVPLAPTGVKAVPGDGNATVSWTAPATNGSAITGYKVTSSPGSFTCSTTGAKTCTVAGLTNGTAYTFRVTARNARGTGAASAPSVPVAPNIIIAVGTEPVGISSDGIHVWVPNLTDNTVTELNASDGSLVQTIPVGAGPKWLSTDGTHVWVANFTDNTVTELNASDGSLVQNIFVGSQPKGISSDGTHVWVTSGGTGPGNGTVTELNVSDGSLVQTTAVGAGPYGISSDGTHVWVANTTDNTVTELVA